MHFINAERGQLLKCEHLKRQIAVGPFGGQPFISKLGIENILLCTRIHAEPNPCLQTELIRFNYLNAVTKSNILILY